jgi:hypothetical protein
VREYLAVIGGERGEELFLASQKVCQRIVNPLTPGVGERDQNTSTVGGVGVSGYQAALDQAVDAIGHRAACDHGFGRKCPSGQGVGRAGTTKGGQHIELPGLESVLGECGGPSAIKVAGKTGDSREHVQRSNVEVGPLATPRIDNVIDFVAS